MPLNRAIAIAKMRDALRKGVSASRFITEMRSAGLAYRRTDMLADWRSVNELEKKAGVLRYVRKDYYPAKTSIAQVEWQLSREFMYKVKTESRLRPDEPIAERFVNIMSDTPLTPRQIEQQVQEAWATWQESAAGELVGLQVWTAVHKVME